MDIEERRNRYNPTYDNHHHHRCSNNRIKRGEFGKITKPSQNLEQKYDQIKALLHIT